MNIKQQYDLLKQVFEHGKTLQYKTLGGNWTDVEDSEILKWTYNNDCYRIKPEPREWRAIPASCPNRMSDMWPVSHGFPKHGEGWIRVREVLD